MSPYIDPHWKPTGKYRYVEDWTNPRLIDLSGWNPKSTAPKDERYFFGFVQDLCGYNVEIFQWSNRYKEFYSVDRSYEDAPSFENVHAWTNIASFPPEILPKFKPRKKREPIMEYVGPPMQRIIQKPLFTETPQTLNWFPKESEILYMNEEETQY